MSNTQIKTRGRGFFGSKKVQEARESFARKEEELKRQIELEQIEDLKELLDLDNLIKLRNKWVDSEHSFDVNKYIDDLVGQDLNISAKAGIDVQSIKLFFQQETQARVEETRLSAFRDETMRLDGSTSHAYKMSIEKELRKLHSAKKEMIDAIESLKKNRDCSSIEAAFDKLVSQVNDKIEAVNVDIQKLVEFNRKKREQEANSIFSLKGVNINVLTKKFEQFQFPDVQQLVDDSVEKQVNNYTSSLTNFVNENKEFKSFIKLKNIKCLNKGPSPSVCVIRNLDLIRNLEKRYPNLFISFDSVLKRSTNPKIKYKQIYDSIDFFNLDKWNSSNWRNRKESSTLEFNNVEYDYIRMISVALTENQWLDKIVLLPTIRMCDKLNDYCFIDHLPGNKVFELKDRKYLSLMKKAHRIHYLPFIELDIMKYFSYFQYSGLHRKHVTSIDIDDDYY